MHQVTIQGRKFRRPTRHHRVRRWTTPKREWRRFEPFRYVRHETPDTTVYGMTWDNGEGTSFAYWTIDWEEDRVTKRDGGRDCDGYLEHTTEYRIEPDGTWVCVDDEVYDEFARAAGY